MRYKITMSVSGQDGSSYISERVILADLPFGAMCAIVFAAKDITEEHGGTVDGKSKENRGS